MYTHNHTRTHTHTHARAHTHTYMCVCVYVHIHVLHKDTGQRLVQMLASGCMPAGSGKKVKRSCVCVCVLCACCVRVVCVLYVSCVSFVCDDEGLRVCTQNRGLAVRNARGFKRQRVGKPTAGLGQ